MKVWRATLAVQLVFFAVWGGGLLLEARGGTEVWLETRPVDPRDFLSGHFVALSYAIESVPPGCPRTRGPKVFVRLAPSAREIQTVQGPVAAWEALECGLAPGTDGVWVAADYRGSRLDYGIGRYFVNEDSPLRNARSGQVVVKGRATKRNRLAVADLVLTRP